MLPAAGNERPPAIRKCRADCLSCPALIRKNSFISYTTGRIHTVVDIDPQRFSCKLQNYIYLLSCSSCGLQYVGESISPLNRRMNTHRTAKSGCEISINHYKNVCPGATFKIQIIEKLPGNGYKDGAIDDDMRKYRLKREDYWMKTLRTLYPYGLNEKTKDMNKDLPTGKLFPPLPRYGSKFINQRARNPHILVNELSNLQNFLQHLQTLDTLTRGNSIRKLLERFKIKDLKSLASQAHSELDTCSDKNLRWLKLVIDIFLTKVYEEEPKKKRAPQHILPIFFDNKGFEFIKLSRILHDEDVIGLLPQQLRNDDVPSIVYSLSSTIRNKIFNYKATVNDIDFSDSVSYGTGIIECDCKNSPFVDANHQHVVTGDLRIISNSPLRKLLTKGPNYREPKTINWRKCREKIDDGLNSCIAKMIASKKDLHDNDIQPWKAAILQRVDEKIASLKRKIKPQRSNPVLKQPEVQQYLQELHEKYVLVPIDKAANNVAIICKKHYVDVIIKEIGGNLGTDTYAKSDLCKEEIMSDSQEFSKRVGLKVEGDDLNLPIMYWMPKMHKSPSGSRFIIASKHCSTKPLSKAVSNAFKLIFRQIENFHKNAKFLSNYNKFWVLQNCDPILSTLKSINKKKNAKSISTYDFSTLYTKLPHDKLTDRLSRLIDFVFKGGDKSFIKIGNSGQAFWARSKKGTGFTNGSLKMAVAHLIENCYFSVGNIIMRQAIGIPMGIDPAPFWANLFLYTYEEEFISNLMRTNKVEARHFHSTKRFIDDLCAINDGGLFGRVYRDIYPGELELKVEHSGQSASFLNLDISISDGIFVYKLFDKRDAFPFFIVRMPHLDSNIPKSIFYSALVGEFLRIARSTLNFQDFIDKAKSLVTRMINQGGREVNSTKSIRKIINRHLESFSQFNISTDDLLKHLFP